MAVFVLQVPWLASSTKRDECKWAGKDLSVRAKTIHLASWLQHFASPFPTAAEEWQLCMSGHEAHLKLCLDDISSVLHMYDILIYSNL